MPCRCSQRMKRTVIKYVRLTALVTLGIILCSPLRNAVLSPVFPGPWLAFNSFRLTQMLMDNQHFPIIDGSFPQPEASQEISLKVNLSELDKYIYREDPFQEFFRQRNILTERAKLGHMEAVQELAMMDSFKPIMSLKERAQLIFTMDVFMKACKKHGLLYFISEGSLLGSYRHHGLIPWDDDIDVILNGSEWRKIRRVFSAIPGFTLFAPPDSQWKFYLSDLPAFKDKLFKYPHLDIFFFTQHGPYVWGLTWGVKHHLMIETKYLFPLSTVKFEMLQEIPAPACVKRMVMSNYGIDICITPEYVHKTDEKHFMFQTNKMNCSRLYKYYPFVFRQEVPGGKIVESRMVGNKVIENVTVLKPPSVCFQD